MHIKGRNSIEIELAKRREHLLRGGYPELLEALLREMPGLRDAITVDHIPEQFEDIFSVLVDPDRVAIVEIAREPAKQMTSFEIVPAVEYVKNLSARRRREFMVAREMMSAPRDRR